MNDTQWVFAVAFAIGIGGLVAYLTFLKRRNEAIINTESKNKDGYSVQLQLTAYERLTLLVDRIALQNIIPRLNNTNFSARDLQQALTQSIREEFEYNISQQIYVSADAWSAVKNLKEQNMLIVNQTASTLPANATGLDLAKNIMDYLMNHRVGTLHEVVSEVLSYEAKKLL